MIDFKKYLKENTGNNDGVDIDIISKIEDSILSLLNSNNILNGVNVIIDDINMHSDNVYNVILVFYNESKITININATNYNVEDFDFNINNQKIKPNDLNMKHILKTSYFLISNEQFINDMKIIFLKEFGQLDSDIIDN